jgi:hypothetical protein
MGEAKRRGTLAQRAAEAASRLDAIRPEMLICNGCQAKLSEVFDLPAQNITGLRGVFAAHCSICDSNTIGFVGEPESVARYMELFAEDKVDVKIGSQPIR